MQSVTIDGVVFVRADSVPAPAPGPLSIVRTIDMGVHIGEVASIEGRTVVLRHARRLWRWRGANTLNEIALRGVTRSEHTRISEVIPEITLLSAGEIIPVAEGVDLTPVWNQ